MLPWGKSLLNVKSCISATGPDHSKNRETGYLDHSQKTEPVSGGQRDRKVCQTIKCPKYGTHLPVGSRLNPFENLGSLGSWTRGSTNVEGGFHFPFPVKTKLGKVTQNYKLLCTSSQELILVRGITSAYGRDAVEPVQNLCASSAFLGSKITQPLETYSRSEQTKPFGDHQDHPPTMGVGYLNRFQGRLLPYTNTGTVQDISGADIPVQSTVFRSVHCTHGTHCSSKGVETDCHTRGYNNPPVLTRLVGESHIPPELSPAYTISSENMPSIKLAGEFRKIRTGTKSRSSTL